MPGPRQWLKSCCHRKKIVHHFPYKALEWLSIDFLLGSLEWEREDSGP